MTYLVPIGLNLPEELQGYHSLAPLEAHAGTERRKLGNWFSVVYRAIRSSDGMPYALRRVESKRYIHYMRYYLMTCSDFRLTNQSAFGPIEVWSNLRHPNIVSVKEAFTTRSFSDNCSSCFLFPNTRQLTPEIDSTRSCIRVPCGCADAL
jgi:PAB-dependent poly(A)-specific ribonuclease subunit 3